MCVWLFKIELTTHTAKQWVTWTSLAPAGIAGTPETYST